jgi:hypothetical protein
MKHNMKGTYTLHYFLKLSLTLAPAVILTAEHVVSDIYHVPVCQYHRAGRRYVEAA